MSTARAGERGASPRAWAQLHPALVIAIVYLASRVVTTALFAVAAELAVPGSRFGQEPPIGDLLTGWDGQWYWFIAVNGYPTELPLTAGGEVAENAWAFMPVYAYLAAAVGAVLGSWGAGAVFVSLLAGYGASLVAYRLWRTRADAPTARWAVVLLVAGPFGALFQIAYAEALFLFLLLCALLALVRRRFVWLYVLIPLMGFTRPGVLAFALLLGVYGIARWLRRAADPLAVREIVHIVAGGALATIVGFAWQVIAAAATGRADAYLATELAWRRSWLGSDDGFVPFSGFIEASRLWFRTWGLGEDAGILALVVLVAALAALLLFEPHVRRAGMEIRLWCASYLLYLFAVFFPQSSVFRLLFPLSPLWVAVAAPRSWVWRLGIAVLGLAGQWWWIYNMYALGNTYWQIP